MKIFPLLLPSFLISVSASRDTTQTDSHGNAKYHSKEHERLTIMQQESKDFFSRMLESSGTQSMPTHPPTSAPSPSAMPVPSDIWDQVGNNLVQLTTETIRSASTALSSDGTILALGLVDTVTLPQGEVHVYTSASDNGSWEPLGSTLQGSNPQDYFGVSVALSNDGTILAVGATEYIEVFGSVPSGAGLVTVYSMEAGGDWVPRGEPVRGTNLGDGFGIEVALSGDGMVLAVLANNYTFGGSMGYAKVYHFNDANLEWDLVDTIEQWSGTADMTMSLSNDGNVIAVGDTRDGISGSIRTWYCQKETGCESRGQEIKGVDYEDMIGASVSLSGGGKYIAVGSPGSYDCAFNTPTCVNVKVYEFQRGSEPIWTQIGQELNGWMGFGSTLKISADGLHLVINAPKCTNESGDCFYAGDDEFYSTTQLYTITELNIWEMVGNPLDVQLLAFSVDASTVAGVNSESIVSVYRRDD